MGNHTSEHKNLPAGATALLSAYIAKTADVRGLSSAATQSMSKTLTLMQKYIQYEDDAYQKMSEICMKYISVLEQGCHKEDAPKIVYTFSTEKLRQAVSIASEQLDMDNAEDLYQEVLPLPASSGKKLTISDLISILGVLIAILALLLQQMPDPQLTLLAEQNEVIIQQQEEIKSALEDGSTTCLEAIWEIQESIDMIQGELSAREDVE